MYYYTQKSRNKIVHTKECFHIRNTDLKDVGWFEKFFDIYGGGYKICKHCSPLMKNYRKEEKDVVDFCMHNGLSIKISNSSMSVITPRSKWKIAMGDDTDLTLFHKNSFETERDHLSDIKGYHRQYDTSADSILAYLGYIVNHDRYRMLNPVIKPKKKKAPKVKKPPKQFTQKYKNAQKREKKRERIRSINNVLSLIDSLHSASDAI